MDITVDEFVVEHKPMKMSELLAMMEQQCKTHLMTIDLLQDSNRQKDLQINALKSQIREQLDTIEKMEKWMQESADTMVKAETELEKYKEMDYPTLYYKYVHLAEWAKEYYLSTKQEQKEVEHDWLAVAKAVGISEI